MFSTIPFFTNCSGSKLFIAYSTASLENPFSDALSNARPDISLFSVLYAPLDSSAPLTLIPDFTSNSAPETPAVTASIVAKYEACPTRRL
jgi:hypothetical protein